MATNIKCPSCNFEFPLEEALNDELKESIEKEKNELRHQMIDFKKTKEEELKKAEQIFQKQLQQKEEELSTRVTAEKQKIQQELQESLKKSITADFENRVKMLQDDAAEKDEKLKLARQKEIEFLQKEQALKTKEEELQLSLQRQLVQEREKIKEQFQKEEVDKIQLKEQEFQLRTRELEKQIEDQKKLVDEMKRKAEQGSMQLQGEVQELLLEELLQTTFPFDNIAPVGKGVRGADCIQTVRNQLGNEVGKIIFESKRTKDFTNDWIEKLKTDMRNLGADVAVIVTHSETSIRTRHIIGLRNAFAFCIGRTYGAAS